jgi:hypothetical protein
MQERWDLVGPYPTQLRSYVPVLTTYTDSAFPSDDAVDKGLRVALRYEVGRFFAALERFKQASVRKSLDEAYIAYSEMSLHLDRYVIRFVRRRSQQDVHFMYGSSQLIVIIIIYIITSIINYT